MNYSEEQSLSNMMMSHSMHLLMFCWNHELPTYDSLSTLSIAGKHLSPLTFYKEKFPVFLAGHAVIVHAISISERH